MWCLVISWQVVQLFVPGGDEAMAEDAGKTILVADDSATSRLMIKTRLAMQGYRVIEAASGAEAVQVATAESPALLMLDFFLGDMTAPEVLTALRADAATQGLPVIVLSGNDSEDDRSACEALGLSGFLIKPYEPDVLLEKVKEALGDTG